MHMIKQHAQEFIAKRESLAYISNDGNQTPTKGHPVFIAQHATIIISQIPVSGWHQLFGDFTYADACLSRMTSKAYRLEFPGRDRRVNNGN